MNESDVSPGLGKNSRIDIQPKKIISHRNIFEMRCLLLGFIWTAGESAVVFFRLSPTLMGASNPSPADESDG